MGETCGAVTGAFMVIGMKHGMARKGDDKERDTTYKLVERFVREFNARNATVICRELLGCDISTSEGMKKIKKENLFRTRCPKFVQDAAEILEEMLEP